MPTIIQPEFAKIKFTSIPEFRFHWREKEEYSVYWENYKLFYERKSGIFGLMDSRFD